MIKRLVDQDARDRVRTDLDTSFCVEAGAGTGKTTLLIDRYLAIIRSGRATCSQVVAITFTEKAAGEMKVRLRTAIMKLIESGDCGFDEKERLKAARDELERAPISTIHAFAAGVLREHPFEAGVDPLFTQLDALEGSLFLDASWNNFLARLGPPHDAILKRYLSLGGGTAVQLRGAIVEAVYASRGDRALSGLFGDGGRDDGGPTERTGAGEGGTAAGREVPDPAAGSLEFDRFRAAAEEGARRLAVLAERHCTDHRDRGYREIQRFLEESRVMEHLEGQELEDFLLLLRLPRAQGNKGNWNPPQMCTEQKRICTELSELQAVARMAVTDRLRDGLEEWLRKFIAYTDRRKAEEGVLDFDDLLIRTRELLKNPDALRTLRRRYRYLLVDEFQDTDPLQAEIIFMLAGEEDGSGSVRPVPGKLFIVGDPKQSIYRFRKADVEIYEEVKERITGHGSHLHITQNFRSLPGIV
ncbi:MAG: UvrD-helicase domain-containing protein, partial [bacterium]